MRIKRSAAQFAQCHICDQKKLVWWRQRGVTNVEWVRVCSDCERKIFKTSRRNPKPKNQLDLFAK